MVVHYYCVLLQLHVKETCLVRSLAPSTTVATGGGISHDCVALFSSAASCHIFLEYPLLLEHIYRQKKRVW